MKFVFLCHSLNIGGIETYILRFANWLKHKHSSHELHVVCKSGIFGPYEDDYRRVGVSLHAIPMGYLNPLNYFYFYTFLQRSKFDAICDFSGDLGALSVCCAYAAKIPKRVVFYRNARSAYKETSYKKVYQFFMNHFVRVFSTKILSNSQEALIFYYPDYPFNQDFRFKILPNGIPLPETISQKEKEIIRREIGINEKQKMILHVGSGRWEKNHKLILNVAKMCKEKGINVCFCLVGPNVERKYGDTVKKTNLNNVCFLGVRRDIGKLLQISDMFIFPSLSEGQPNALLEAMMAGLPFIASDIGPIREVFPVAWEGGRWLFPPDNSEKAYFLLISHLNNDFRQEKEFRELVRWCQSNFDENTCFDNFLDVLAC